jgi:hypothetical protein
MIGLFGLSGCCALSARGDLPLDNPLKVGIFSAWTTRVMIKRTQ